MKNLHDYPRGKQVEKEKKKQITTQIIDTSYSDK